VDAVKRVEAGIGVPYICRELGISTAREWLSPCYWSDLAEAQDFETKWMWSYNHDRPNMALGGFTPKQRLVMAA